MASIATEAWQYDESELTDLVYDLIRDIRDPEKPETLEELNVVYEEGVKVSKLNETIFVIEVEFTPTVSHCHLATLIGLCIRVKLLEELPEKHKIDIVLKKGTHETEAEVIKQINDKERVAAALENPNLRKLVDECIACREH